MPPPGSLRAPGAVLLLSCYELGHPPHGLALPLAFLERAGFRPRAIDLAVDPLDEAAAREAGLVVMSVPMHTALRLGTTVARRVRALNPTCQIAFTGLYAPLNAALLARLGACAALGGECEPALVRLAEALDRGDPPPPGPAAPLTRIDFPAPSRAPLPPLDRYARLERTDGTRALAGYVESTRGCLDTCRHCPVPSVYRGRFFVVPRRRVLDDIAAQVAAGARHITFGDPDFLNGPGHGMAIARALAHGWPGVTFDVTAQVSHLLRRRELLPELAALGCAFVVTAVESLSDRVLEKLKKRHRRRDVEELVGLARGAGLAIRPTFVPFTPWTELEDVRELVDFIAREDLVDNVGPVQLAVRLLVPPGSLLLDAAETRDAFGPLEPEALTHRWAHADPRVDALAEALARTAAEAAASGEAPARTFAAMRALVYRATGAAPPPELPRPRPRLPLRRKAPRLTEPWFC